MTTDRECPECGTSLGVKATYCGCGWGKRKKGQSAPAYRAPCAYMSCPKSSVEKVASGANLCDDHMQEYYRRKAEETCAALGLVTTEQRRKYVLEKAKGMWRMREPGEDLEEAA